VLWNGKDKKTFDASMNAACFLGDVGEVSKYDQIVCLDSETGEVKWKSESARNGILATTSEGVFVAYTGFPSRLSKYDLQSGNLTWREDFYDSNPIGMLFFDNQIQLITWKPGRKLRLFDTDGNALKVISDTQAFLMTPEVSYNSGTGIQAVQTDTNKVLWDHLDAGVAFIPIFTQDKIFCSSESDSGIAYALDRETGNLLWQVNDIVYDSTIAYSQEKQLVYVLRNNGDLLAIDENTGKINIVAIFSSAPFLLNIDGTVQAYRLTYDYEQHVLLVSLGDSHQLFAFREE
jgi:outer membrane protein assembly factor BamB